MRDYDVPIKEADHMDADELRLAQMGMFSLRS